MNAATHTEKLSLGRANLRAYLAGTGATGALVGGAVVVFLALAAFVAFNGLPLGAAGSSEGSVSIGQQRLAGAPESAAVALRGASRAVNATPAGAAGGSGAAGGNGQIVGLNGSGGPPSGDTTGTFSGGGGDPPVTDPSGGGDGPVTPVVHDVPGAPSGTTDPITQQADETARNTLNTVGGVVDKPTLGDQTVNRVNGVTDSLLGHGGAVNNLLPGG